jgi:hypothetical protein
MNTSKKITQSDAPAKKASPKMKDLGARSNPSGGSRGGKGRHQVHWSDRAYTQLEQREANPHIIQY